MRGFGAITAPPGPVASGPSEGAGGNCERRSTHSRACLMKEVSAGHAHVFKHLYDGYADVVLLKD